MGINVKTGVVTASYANVWKPKPNKQGKLKYSICLLIDKSKKDDVKAYEEAIKAASTRVWPRVCSLQTSGLS